MAFILTKKRIIQPVQTGDVTFGFRRFEGEERDRFEKERARIANGPRKSYLTSLGDLCRQVAATLLVYWIGVLDEDGNPLGVPYLDENGKEVFDEAGRQAYTPTSIDQIMTVLLHRESLVYWDPYISHYLFPPTNRAEWAKGKKGADEPDLGVDEGEAVTPDFLSVK